MSDLLQEVGIACGLQDLRLSRVVILQTERLLVKHLFVQHNKSTVLWKQSIGLYQNAPALRSQIIVTWMTLILIFANFLVLSNEPFVLF